MQELLLFALGSSLGSFCNVCIYRLPRGMNVVTARSFCPHCKSTLRWFELIPLVSYVMFRGKCLRCASRISVQYPVVETISGFIVVLAFLEYGLSAASVGIVFFLLTMLVVAFTDWQRLVIPNEVLLVSFVAGVVLEVVSSANYNSVFRVPFSIPLSPVSFPLSPFSFIISSVVSFAVMFLILLGGNFIFKKQAMGFGDVKLAGVIGLYVGWKMFLVVLWTATFAGALYGLFMIFILKKSEETKLPFGAFLAVAASVAVILETRACQ